MQRSRINILELCVNFTNLTVKILKKSLSQIYNRVVNMLMASIERMFGCKTMFDIRYLFFAIRYIDAQLEHYPEVFLAKRLLPNKDDLH